MDRKAEHLAAFGVHNIFSVAKSAHDVKEGTYYISVEAKKAVKFRVLAMFIHAEMKPGDHSHGEVCPGNMVFHYYQKGDAGAGGHRRRLQGAAPGGGAGKDYRFRVVLHVGDVRYMEAHLHPPLELIPPYRTALTSDPAEDHPHADVCRDAHDGKHYIALFGGTEVGGPPPPPAPALRPGAGSRPAACSARAGLTPPPDPIRARPLRSAPTTRSTLRRSPPGTPARP